MVNDFKAKKIVAGYVPVGIKIDPEHEDDYPGGEKYLGVSFCDAVRRASDGSGQALLIERDSIQVCRWSPVVLGFAEPDPNLDLKVEFNLQHPTQKVIVAPVDQFAEGNPPDTVLLRAPMRELQKIVDVLGRENTAHDLPPGLDKSALSVIEQKELSMDVKRVRSVNLVIAELNRNENWRNFTKWVFSRQWTTYLFSLLLDRYLANMSMCRNSTAIPFLTGKVNISYFCTGGISWGMNKPKHMTCGMPYELFTKLNVSW